MASAGNTRRPKRSRIMENLETTNTENTRLGGLHHITAVTGDAPRNVAFYTQVLGMRLVKKTVNQDDVSAYHLFYGDSLGHAGTELTFFDWPDAGSNRAGTGTIAAIAPRAHRASLDSLGAAPRRAWRHSRGHRGARGPRHPRLHRSRGAAPRTGRARDGEEESIPGGEPWAGSPIPAEDQIRGLHAVRLHSARHDADGARPHRGDGLPPGRPLRVAADRRCSRARRPHLPDRRGRPRHRGAARGARRYTRHRGRVGIGGVHHVAFRTPPTRRSVAWRERIVESGLEPTPVIDRFYFHSVYFREPGGVLFEIATDGPGFATDEDPAAPRRETRAAALPRALPRRDRGGPASAADARADRLSDCIASLPPHHSHDGPGYFRLGPPFLCPR